MKKLSRSNKRKTGKLEINYKNLERFKLIQKTLAENGIKHFYPTVSVGDAYIVDFADRIIVCSIPIFLYEKIKLIIKEKNKKNNFSIDAFYQQAQVELSCDKQYKKNVIKIIKDSIQEYFQNKIIDTLQGYITLDYSDYPALNDLDNYSTKVAKLYKYAITGFQKSNNFKIIITGNPGTGKSFFARILSKQLLEKKHIGCVMICSPLNLSDIIDLVKLLSLDIKILFIADEMELGATDRNFGLSVSVSKMLNILDGIDEIKNMRFVGISNVPQLIDKALFRPGRIDLLINAAAEKMTPKLIIRIFKSLKFNIKNMVGLADIIYRNFPDVMPISFYGQAIKLYKIYNSYDIVVDILEIFYKHKKMFQYDDGFKPHNSIGYSAGGEDNKVGLSKYPDSPDNGKHEIL